jgi:hypothetical protein
MFLLFSITLLAQIFIESRKRDKTSSLCRQKAKDIQVIGKNGLCMEKNCNPTTYDISFNKAFFLQVVENF